jgi:hypothetical protein
MAPLTKFVYELVQCTWQFRLNARIYFQSAGQPPAAKDIILIPGVPIYLSEFALTLTAAPLGLPPLPKLDAKFILNGTHATTFDWPVTVAQCPNEEAAKAFQCEFDYTTCRDCVVFQRPDLVNCTCYPFDLERDFIRKQLLPTHFEHRKAQIGNGDLIVDMPSTPVNLMIRMEKARLVTKVVKSTCFVKVLSFAGCYNCATGGRIKFSCNATVGRVTGHVICDDYTNWEVECTPEGKEGSIVLTFNQPTVNSICRINCGHAETQFTLNTTLIVLDTKLENYHILAQSKRIKPPNGLELNIPKITKFWFSTVFGETQQKVVALLAGAGFISLFFLCLKCISTIFA